LPVEGGAQGEAAVKELAKGVDQLVRQMRAFQTFTIGTPAMLDESGPWMGGLRSSALGGFSERPFERPPELLLRSLTPGMDGLFSPDPCV